MRNQCQLITYPDSMGRNLPELRTALDTHFEGVFGGIHILPFYPSSADRGFAPITYHHVDPAFGDWEEIRTLAADYDLIFDFMLNHISRQSVYFKDFRKHKDSSKYKDSFIRFKQFWPEGSPSEDDLQKIYTRKPKPPFIEITFEDGSSERIWCTFDPEQIDLNLESPTTRNLITEFLQFLGDRGAAMIRLDAFAYATKKPGTNCFFVEPDVWEILEFAQSAAGDTELLPEIHEHYSIQLKLAKKGYWVYDFALPMLCLQAIYDGDGTNLKSWLSGCPRKQITTLDTHDGIGVVDVHGLMSDEAIERTKNNLFTHGANVKRIYNTPKYNNLDIYQINCTYYSAVGDDDDAYLLARAIQFFTPGIPQVYYVGLLAGRNDIELVERTKTGRDINRHPYTLQEIALEVRRPVVKRLLALMRFRNSYPSFAGEFILHDTPPNELAMEWRTEANTTLLYAEFDSKTLNIQYRDQETGKMTLLSY
jgi:sucrose phosphorylase